MLEVPSLFSCRSSAKLDPRTPKAFVDSSCVRNAAFPEMGAAEVHETIRMQADYGRTTTPACQSERTITKVNYANLKEGRPSGEGAA
jgi:hypothetical protein